MDYLSRKVDKDSASLIFSEFLKAGLALEPLELERFFWLDQTLRRLNEELDLTRIREPKAIVIKHYLDSVLAANLIEPKGPLMDLGSGAGFPGIPMAIMRPDWHIVLAEPRGKRLAFIEEVIDLLGLGNVEVYPHKVNENFQGQIDSMVARDFGPSVGIIALASRILPPGGRLHLMKGPTVDMELSEAARHPSWQSFGDVQDHYYTLGAERIKRRLITLVKNGPKGDPLSGPRRKVTEIASHMNPRFKHWAKLLEGRNIKKTGEALISGKKIVTELLGTDPANVASLLAVGKADYENLNVPDGVEIFHLRPEIFHKLDLFGTGPPLLIVPTPIPVSWRPEEPFVGVRLLVPFQDPSNAGAVIRSAAAMGVDVILLKEAANPYHPKALRAAGPAVFKTTILSGPSISELPMVGNMFALTPKGQNIHKFEASGYVADGLYLVMGIEGPGLPGIDFPPERCLAIPMKPGVESLNAATAAAIAMALVTAGDFS
ncbi:MAG: 16S rRNA (guanine(527)-N(7))-methyltransferase RsmG [Deltaproteobacteria bacterium]|jgi:16S rRNA (guanine527-N7)-methyltransferase|nr:16S rRNA (guanine(527)-N(7))-methyltransferase RsmG [Deltaproteobacteria bacterium]